MLVEVQGLDRDDVVVVGELAGLGGEAQVGNRRDFEVGDIEALGPVIFGLVLQLELERLVLEVGELGLGGDLCVADAAGLMTQIRSLSSEAVGMTYRAAGHLVGLAVVVLVIRRVSVAVHSHDIGEHGAGAVVLVRVEEDAEALELVH